MDYEKYKNALEKAKIRYNEIKGTDCNEEKFLLDIFPELKESEDERIRKALVRFHKSTIDVDGIKGEEIVAWLEKQGEKKPIMNVPSREVILAIWDLGNEWKELTNGDISTEYGTQLDYIQKHWHESEYYLREKQGEQKPINDTIETIVEAVSNTSILDMIEDKDAFTNPSAFENSLGRLLKLFEKLPKQDLLDGLKFYTNVVEHDGEYVKPAEWSDEDEKMYGMCVEAVEYYHSSEDESTIRDWLKSLKERLS